MATEKPRFTITVSDQTLKRIEDYQYTTRQKNRNEAVIRLIEFGLDEFEGVDETKMTAFRATRGDLVAALERIIMLAQDSLGEKISERKISRQTVNIGESRKRLRGD